MNTIYKNVGNTYEIKENVVNMKYYITIKYR